MYKDIEDFIKVELKFCKEMLDIGKDMKDNSRQEYWQGRIDELNIMLDYINN